MLPRTRFNSKRLSHPKAKPTAPPSAINSYEINWNLSLDVSPHPPNKSLSFEKKKSSATRRDRSFPFVIPRARAHKPTRENIEKHKITFTLSGSAWFVAPSPLSRVYPTFRLRLRARAKFNQHLTISSARFLDISGGPHAVDDLTQLKRDFSRAGPTRCCRVKAPVQRACAINRGAARSRAHARNARRAQSVASERVKEKWGRVGVACSRFARTRVLDVCARLVLSLFFFYEWLCFTSCFWLSVYELWIYCKGNLDFRVKIICSTLCCNLLMNE